MTFKHINFEDSETMRSLVKLAKEKGLVKEDPLKKIASRKPKLDLRPTENLSENLMKLCSGLRASGMEKYAEELELTFIQYKQAAASECDNKLIQDAHPKGSPFLEGVAGDAVIETIIDEHLAMMRVVEKMPTGKLSNAKSIINAVKTSLGEELPIDIDDSRKQLLGKDYLSKGYENISAGANSLITVLPNFLPSGIASNYIDDLKQINKDIANFKKEADSDVKIDQYKMNIVFNYIHQVRIKRDAFVKLNFNSFNVAEQDKRTAFNAIAQIDRGISLIWAANQAFRVGRQQSAIFQEQQIPFGDIIEALTPLRLHYEDLSQKVSQIDLNNINDKYRIAVSTWIENIGLENSDIHRVIAKLNKSQGAELRIMHPNQISALFSTELKDKLAAQNLTSFRAKVNTVIAENNDDYATLTSPGYAK